MTAAELHAIVKDVTREAWPKGLQYWGVTGTPHFYRETAALSHDWVSDDYAEILFTGSMVKWLVERDVDPEIRKGKDGRAKIVYYSEREPKYNDVEGGSILHALAAAVKAVQEPTQ